MINNQMIKLTDLVFPKPKRAGSLKPDKRIEEEHKKHNLFRTKSDSEDLVPRHIYNLNKKKY